MSNRVKHTFGDSINILAAIESGTINAYDVLFLDSKTEPKVGWIDKDGTPVIVDTQKVVMVEDKTLPESGVIGKIYIFEEQAHFWNGTKFVNLSVSASEKELEKLFEEFKHSYMKIKYEIAHKPVGALVDYREKEIRVLCPEGTEWSFQQSGENADKNSYYIGLRIYAPSDDIVSFKEALDKKVTDDTMYYFEGNDFANIDEYGRSYSIVWLPVAVYDESTATWTYYGDNSSEDKYVGWYYSVEWYNADEKLVGSDCIRINLTNKDCHSAIKPFYLSDVTKEVDTKIQDMNEQLAQILESITVVEF